MKAKERYTLAFQNLLFHEPLYRFVEKEDGAGAQQGVKRKMNVLAIGWNLAVEMFVDQCLQAGQMDTLALCVWVVTGDAGQSAREYTDARPAMTEFVDITVDNAALDEKTEDPYAELHFVSCHSLEEIASVRDRREDILMDIVAGLPEEKQHYFLISVGDDEANREIADSLDRIVETWELAGPHTVHYVLEGSTDMPEAKRATPVYTTGIGEAVDIDPELDRIAFNVHLGWQDVIHGDNKSLYKKFKGKKEEDIYNYCSSVAMALSIKYKLADVPDLEETVEYSDRNALDQTAENFYRKLAGEEQRELLLRLAALEHRRWNLFMAADGWQAPGPEEADAYYESCFERQDLKNRKNKRHLCMVRSTPDPSLQKKGKEFWEREIPDGDLREELERLDELDRVSVITHWQLLDRAENYLDSDPMHCGTIAEIQATLLSYYVSDDVMREWKRFRFCLGNILDGSLGYSKKFEYYRDSFLNTANEKEPLLISYLIKKIKVLCGEIWPAIQANQRVDYKKYDEEYIWKIPFYLTYRTDLTLALSFDAGKHRVSVGDMLFRHVASAAVIRPQQILYLVSLSEGSNPDFFRQRVVGVRKYFVDRSMDCSIHFVAFGEITEDEKKGWEKCFRKLKEDKVIQSFVVKRKKPDRELMQVWDSLLKKWEEDHARIDLYDGTIPLFESVRDNMEFLEMVRQGEGSLALPCFEFDNRGKTFRHNEDCRFLSYIDDHSYLSVEELLSLSDMEVMAFVYPGLSRDYTDLWEIYKGTNRGYEGADRRLAAQCWKYLCMTLGNIAKKKTPEESGHFMLDDLDIQLMEESFFKTKEVKAKNQFKDEVAALLCELAGYSGQRMPEGEILDDEEKSMAYLINRADRTDEGKKRYLDPDILRESGYILGFAYSNEDVQNLLNDGGAMLEIYLYHKAREAGSFDDFAGHIRFKESASSATNEIDLIATRGFRSWIVECKDTVSLNSDFYYKLANLEYMIGVNSQSLLVTTVDTTKEGSMQHLARGNMLGIDTVSGLDAIDGVFEDL